MPDGWRTIKSLVHNIRLHGRRGKGMAESFSREKLRHAPQKEGGWEIPCDLPPVWPRLVRPTNLMSRMNGKKTHTHTHTQHNVLSLQLKKLRWHNKSVIDLSNASPASCGHKEVPSQGQRIASWWQPATQTNRDPNRDKKLCDSASNGTEQYQTDLSNLLTPYREQPRWTRV